MKPRSSRMCCSSMHSVVEAPVAIGDLLPAVLARLNVT